MSIRLVFVAALVAVATGCHSAKSPELRVIGQQDEAREVVYVQVTNPASRPMRLTRLEYRFASAKNKTVAEGELSLAREVSPGEAVVVEVPLEQTSEQVTLRGNLIAEQDHMIKSFKVSAQIQPTR